VGDSPYALNSSLAPLQDAGSAQPCQQRLFLHLSESPLLPDPGRDRFRHAGILLVTTSILKRFQAFCRLQTFTCAAQLFLSGEVYMIGSGSARNKENLDEKHS
jgi:hypothetical protein